MRASPRHTLLAAATAAVLTTSILGAAAPANGEPETANQSSATKARLQGEAAHDHQTTDNRSGRVAPTGAQRSAAKGQQVRWNDLGTPASVTDTGATALARSLSGGPVAAARAYLKAEKALFGLEASDVDDLEVVTTAPIGKGSAVVLRQRLGGLPAAVDGLVTLGVLDGSIVSVSSSLTRDTSAPAKASLSGADALASALDETGLAAGDLAQKRVREVAVPTADGNRAAYQVVLMGKSKSDPVGRTTYVDARTGDVLVDEDLVDEDADNPKWDVFPANPPADYSSTDTRQIWCWTPTAGCQLPVGDNASPLPWDVDPATRTSTFTTSGNNAIGVEKWNSASSSTIGTNFATPRPDRNYTYPWTNQWQEEKCSMDVFTSPARNDIDAATANLFAQHNRMHDWSYELGFTENTWNLQKDNFGRGDDGNDHERGNAQAGGIAGGYPSFSARDNANQATPPDGMAPVTNMYLWQPIAGAFYAPCVDGDYDMSVIGHEYSHAITNRMIAGPDNRILGAQGGAMGESWGDQFAMEQMFEAGFRPAGATPYVTGAYATGDQVTGIRNYDMSKSPLNYSDIGYDLTGVQVHADGEIWSATGFALRRAFLDRYGEGTPAQQTSCYRGETPATSCPGNRRWVQLHFDSLVLQASSFPSFVDMRDNILAADAIRFGGANHDIIWNTFASRGLGEDAVSITNADGDPTPSFSSPHADNATLRLKGAGDAARTPFKLFIGDYEGRATPIADTDPTTPLSDTFEIVPGRYNAVAQGNGLGHRRLTLDVKRGQVRDLPVNMAANLASASNGATATGDGTNFGALIDDTEASNWEATGAAPQGRSVTVDLAGDKVVDVRRVQVSSLLRPVPVTNPPTPSQNRFTALRSFKLAACAAKGGEDCSGTTGYRTVFTSKPDAFPAGTPRPTAPDLTLRSFDVGHVKATHLRLIVVDSQCTGAPDYAGEQDNEPRAIDDCEAGAAATTSKAVRASELQAFAR